MEQKIDQYQFWLEGPLLAPEKLFRCSLLRDFVHGEIKLKALISEPVHYYIVDSVKILSQVLFPI